MYTSDIRKYRVLSHQRRNLVVIEKIKGKEQLPFFEGSVRIKSTETREIPLKGVILMFSHIFLCDEADSFSMSYAMLERFSANYSFALSPI